MTDQDPQYQSNQENKSLPEGAVQPPTMEQGSENPVQPPMATPVPENAIQPSSMGPNPENPAQWPIMEQGSEKPVPNTGLLTFVFFLNIGYLGLFIGSALMVGG